MVVSSSKDAAVMSERPMKARRTAMKAEASLGLSRVVTWGWGEYVSRMSGVSGGYTSPISSTRPG